MKNYEKFQPNGIYKVYFNVEGKNDYIRKATGEIVNYNSGNVVLENRKTKELTILEYRYIVQLFKIKDYEEDNMSQYNDFRMPSDEGYKKMNQSYIDSFLFGI